MNTKSITVNPDLEIATELKRESAGLNPSAQRKRDRPRNASRGQIQRQLTKAWRVTSGLSTLRLRECNHDNRGNHRNDDRNHGDVPIRLFVSGVTDQQ